MEWTELIKIFELTLNTLVPINPGTSAAGIVTNTGDSQILAVWTIIHGIYNNFLGLFQDLTQIIHILDFLPNNWVRLFLVLLILVIALRIYAYFADVEIGGFKI